MSTATTHASPRVFVGPLPEALLSEAVLRGGGALVADMSDADMVVWNDGPASLAGQLHPGIKWVQLAAAGVDDWLASGVIDSDRVWMSGAKTYSHIVAEHALALILAGRHRLAECARQTEWRPELQGQPLDCAAVLIVGAGGIGRGLIEMLGPLRTQTVAVTRSGSATPGAERSVAFDELADEWSRADVIVLAAPATPATYRIINSQTLEMMRSNALIVNIARGSLIDTVALVDALRHDRIGGAALDVTDPEPLPSGHPLWSDPRVLITPHAANPRDARLRRFAERVTDSVSRIGSGTEPAAVIDTKLGY
jgi:phosphoglycerate dehydrogenase-like enzyme